MYSYQYDGLHSISFINQDWIAYPEFTHNFDQAKKMGLTKAEYLGHLRRDGNAHDDRNTWEDWGLIPTSRPIVVPPEQKRTTIEIPGANGNLDLTYKLVPYPIFQNRSGSWGFKVVSRMPWHTLYQEIGSFLHGRDVRVVLQDDPGYYYTGVCSVEGWESANDGSGSSITIAYDLEPYKKSIYSSLEEWIWNPFNFYTDSALSEMFNKFLIKRNTPYISLDDMKKTENDKYWTTIPLTNKIGSMPVIPKISISNASGGSQPGSWEIFIRYRNPSIRSTYYTTISQNTALPLIDNEILFYDPYKRRANDISFYIYSGPSTLYASVDFVKGEIL